MLDASVALAWCFEDEANETSEAVLDRLATERALVPPLWELEVANALAVGERRGRLTEAQSARFLELVGQLPIDLDGSSVAPVDLLAAARRHGISAYDATYLLVAERLGAPLATLDAHLARAATSAGVALVSGP